MDWKVPLFAPDLGDREKKALCDVIDSKWLTQGERTALFEQKFSSFVQSNHAVAVSNCTAALHLALEALDLKAGDEVICPSLTFVATANAIRYTSATPVFADITSLQDWNISRETIEKVITAKTKAIIVVHYAGYVCDMDNIMALASAYNIKVIEDVAHAPGASRDGKYAGTWGDAGCFSFFSNKNMTTGEGGMLITDNDNLSSRVQRMRCHGMTSVTLDRHKGHNFSYDVIEKGFNYRMSELNAAIGLIQLDKLREGNKKREAHVKYYREQLASSHEIGLPFMLNDSKSAFHIMPVLLPETTDRTEVMNRLRERKIQTSIHYRPVHTFENFKVNGVGGDDLLKNTCTVGTRVLTLPLYPLMTTDQVEYVCDSLLKVVKSCH